MYYTGLCLGASSIDMVTLKNDDQEGVSLVEATSRLHEGNPRGLLMDMLKGKEDLCLCVTGRKFRHMMQVPAISEPEATELAYDFCRQGNDYQGIVSAGGETFIYYELDNQGRIAGVHTGSKCASGTGEFFLQQVKRMGLPAGEALQAARGAEAYSVAGRCSVFCKSDCTHALNKGEEKGKVVAGLCKMMAGKILELVHRTEVQKILLVGGTAQNDIMVDYLESELEVTVPREASYFEALGAALWARQEGTKPVAVEESRLFVPRESSFSFRPPLSEAREQVDFKDFPRSTADPGDRLILGLDVGSTTTKAIVMRKEDRAIVASTYLRTDGDPVGASRRCYVELSRQLTEEAEIIGLGVTGSGRQIAGLHALTPAVVNEIIAHARAALYFDPEVDTIFEIGGQDAKYTYIINGVPVDYAMNEACSAGTGSFLEEAASETLEVEMTGIAPLALEAASPPDFNDQCAAFISSDIKTAVQEGLSSRDILGGLVYSICLNYLTRVKNNRPVGKKVFMQGGVCYNRAVPVAMASLLDKEIVVPPEPGLMGAFGVALDVEEKINQGFLEESSFNLSQLINREIKYGKTFTCRGDDNCDRSCFIRMLHVEGQKIPFGGACSRYDRINRKEETSSAGETLDFVHLREKKVFQGRQKENSQEKKGKTIGISSSLMTNTLYPLYHEFFTALGLQVVTATLPLFSGRERQGAPFCFPVELSHGYMAHLLDLDPDYIFLPQVRGLPHSEGNNTAVTCPLVQGEPYYLRTAFPRLQEKLQLLSPVLDFSGGYGEQEKVFIDMAKTLGASPREAREAYSRAVAHQHEVMDWIKEQGKKFLAKLEADSEETGVVLFGRSYNAFSSEANMGIPQKFASRGWKVIPCDFLPFEEEKPFPNMYWASGQVILQVARLVQRHPRLFGVYITNFSCGPDSFLTGYFREIMGSKPSLTLELDGHTSDAGLDTRVEAFLDIVKGYRRTHEMNQEMVNDAKVPLKRPRTQIQEGKVYIELSGGEKLPLDHPRVKLLIPSMGEERSRLLAAVLKQDGVNAKYLPGPGTKELKLGQAHSNCKECLPLHLTVGSLLSYLQDEPEESDDILVYFMPDTMGPCRFGQYQIYINMLLERLGIDNVTTLSLTSENSYGGLGTGTTIRAWQALVIGDVLSEIYSALLVLGRNREESLALYHKISDDLAETLSRESYTGVRRGLERAARELSGLERQGDLREVPSVALLGEIYVRNDSFSRQNLVEYFAEEGIITRVAPLNEWIYYLDYLVQKGISRKATGRDRLKNRIRMPIKRWIEKDVKSILSGSGFYHYHLTDVKSLMNVGKDLISPALTGEAILTVSGAVAELVEEVSGAIALGPFGCMPNRIAEAIASKTLNGDSAKIRGQSRVSQKVFARQPHLPFLAIETDGNVFPQVVEARLESFILQVKRLHQIIREEELEG